MNAIHLHSNLVLQLQMELKDTQYQRTIQCLILFVY
nr:MAG TPA: hypothetical protein [Caudoviricetes sp.]